MLFATIKRPIGKSISVDMLTQMEVNASPLSASSVRKLAFSVVACSLEIADVIALRLRIQIRYIVARTRSHFSASTPHLNENTVIAGIVWIRRVTEGVFRVKFLCNS